MGAVLTPDIEARGEQQPTKSSVRDDNRYSYERLPHKRKNRARKASVLICASVALLVIIFCTVYRNVDEYYETQKNTTNVCYRKEKKMSFSSMFATMLSLIGIVLSTLVDRLSLVAEERHHVDRRYGKSWKKMFKACFSGILWGPVFFLLAFTVIVVIILIITTGKPWFELQYLVYIFSGIGVGPLVMLLLNLNAQCEVHISTILEDKGTCVANVLAWSYYFNHLEKELPEFDQTNTLPDLSLDKLLLLIPLNCFTVEDLTELDRNITKSACANSQSPFQVYDLKVNKNVHECYAIQYVNEPLQTLKKMADSDGIRAVTQKTLEQEVKLFCRTLDDILKNPRDQRCQERVVLVPFNAKNMRTDLQNGGLVGCIVEKVKKIPCFTSDDGSLQSTNVSVRHFDIDSLSNENVISWKNVEFKIAKILQEKGIEQESKTKESKEKNYKIKTPDEMELFLKRKSI